MQRAVIHMDLDCFYAQCEQVRLNLDPTEPLVVTQWATILALNYPSRIHNINRHTPAYEIPPGVNQVHVPVMTLQDPTPKYYNRINKEEGKVSLKIYRDYSKQVMKIVKNYDKNFEKASIDEAYLDVTELVQQRIKQECPKVYIDGYQVGYGSDLDDLGIIHGNEFNSTLIAVDIPCDTENKVDASKEKESRIEEEDQTNSSSGIKIEWTPSEIISMVPRKTKITYGYSDLMLKYALQIAQELKAEIYTKTKMVVSCGVSHNKLLSKLISGQYKPNHVSFLRESNRIEFISDFKVTDVGGFGGKLGESITTEYNIKKCKELYKYGRKELDKFGPIYDKLRGICTEQVKTKQRPDSLQVNKKFKFKLKHNLLLQWINLLCVELIQRIDEEYQDSKRYPKYVRLIMQNEQRITKKYNLPRNCSSQELFELVNQSLVKDVVFLGVVCDGMEVVESKKDYFKSAIKKMFLCELCGEDILNGDRKEHEDFHLAIQLSKRECGGYNEKPKNVPIVERRKEKPIIEHRREKPKIADIFQKSLKKRYTCEACGEEILIVDQKEHEDLHMAIALSKNDLQKRSMNVQRKEIVLEESDEVSFQESLELDEEIPVEKNMSNPIEIFDISDNEQEMNINKRNKNGEMVYYRCLECGGVMESALKQSHLDYHFARNLSRSFEKSKVKVITAKKVLTNTMIKDFFKKK
jgi:nucleotidyltransferase/DNA polymerase involved in DNA repair